MNSLHDMREFRSRARYHIYDTYHFITKANFSKIVNFFRSLTGFYVSRILKKPFMMSWPASISVEPTTSCNLRCPHCISGLRTFTRPTGMLSEPVFRKVIDQTGARLLSLIFYFQGEPFLNPAFFDMTRYASHSGIYTMTSTNGHYLTEENVKRVIRSGLDRLIVSVDHFEQDSYQHYRVGGRIDTVIEGIKTLVRVRSESRSTRPFIILQFLISGDNEFRLAEFRKRGYRLGADRVEFKTMQILDFEKGSPFIPESTKNSRYRKSETNGFRVKYRYFNHCWKMWHSCVVTWDGSVVPCCFDKNAEYPLGSFENENSFSSIWFGDPYKNFRSRLLHRRKEINICSNCTEGTNPWI